MAFPLDIRTELNLAGTWTDISSDVYLRDQKVISRGRRDQGAATDPSSLSLTLNNRDGRYAPRNALSPLYGQIGRNTPIRLSVPGTGSYLQLDADPAEYASTPHTAALTTTDLDVRAEIAPSWYGSNNQMVIGKWGTTTGQRSWYLRVYNGILVFGHIYAPTGKDWYSQVYLPTLSGRAAVRATFTADNGSGQRFVQFYWAASLAGPWTSIGGHTLTGAGSMAATTAQLYVGPTDLRDTRSPRLPMTGRAYAFEVRSSIDGPVIASPDFTAQAAGTTGFTDSSGLPWTLSAGTEIRDREDRFYGEVSSWPAKWSLDGSDVWTPVQASGILRRLGQGQKALDSTLRRRIPSGNPVAYWPMEEYREATRAYSPVTGVDSAALTGVEFAAMDTLVSSGPLPRLSKAASLSAKVPTSMPSGAWQVECVYNADDKIPTDTHAELLSVSCPDGTVRRWTVSMMLSSAKVIGTDASGDEIVRVFVDIADDVFHGWTRLRLWAEEDAGTVSWRIGWQDVGGGASVVYNTYPGTAGRVSYVTAAWGAGTEGWGFGHLLVLAEANSLYLTGADDAYHAETAWARMRRLAYEESIPLTLIPGELITAQVGYQRQVKILDLLEHAAQADGGMLLEDPRRVGLLYRSRASLYTQEPALTLSYTAPGLGPDLEPVDDDSAVRNDILVTRDGGSSGRAFLSEGPLSTQLPPAGIGLYDEAVTLSLAHDIQPEPVANWRLHLGTFDGARYPTVSVTLHKPGAEVHIPAVLGLREGDVIRLTDLPPWVAHGDVDLMVEGWTESLDMYCWTIVFNCSPGGPWNVAMTDHALHSRAGTVSAELVSAVDSAATSLSVLATDADAVPWTTAAPDFPLDIEVGGEVMTVTGISGATSPQTFAVTRATNGVAKSHLAGAPVTLAYPAIAAL